jgi:hypothetical protein
MEEPGYAFITLVDVTADEAAVLPDTPKSLTRTALPRAAAESS